MQKTSQGLGQKPMDSVVALAHMALTPAQASEASALLSALDEQQWPHWLNQIETHGLAGLAAKHISEHAIATPSDIRLSLKALNIRHRAAAQARLSVLTEIDAIFKQHDLPYLALKGAALMPHLYLSEELRPMRDMDLLLPKNRIHESADYLREIGFTIPDQQPSEYMRDMHQLPNATKTVNGFLCSVELHLDGISREVPGHFYYPEKPSDLQTVEWQGLRFNALEDHLFLHQVAKHLEGLHPLATLKLINVVDVIALAEHVLDTGDWARMQEAHPHVINTLRCLHLYTPLPASLQAQLQPMPSKTVSGVGEIMGSLRSALTHKQPLVERLQKLFQPSDWWLHLYYNVDPDKSLIWVKLVKHPLRILNWLSRRVYSKARGG